MAEMAVKVETNRRKGNMNCCVVNCFHSFKNSPPGTHFYTFPTAVHKRERRNKWITLINRKNPDGTLWQPSMHSRICSAHFVGNEKSENPLSPSYNPTIFPDVYKKRPVNPKTVVERHQRYKNFELKRQQRCFKGQASQASLTTLGESANVQPIFEHQMEQKTNFLLEETADKGVEANFLEEENRNHGPQIFICNRYIYSNHGEAETQAFFPEAPKKMITMRKVKKK